MGKKMDWAALDHMTELYPPTDVEMRMELLYIIQAHQPPQVTL